MPLHTGAIRFFKSGTKCFARVELYCHVKPGVSAAREGILAVTDERVEIGVCIPAKQGEANKAVIDVLSRTMGTPKSDLKVTRGLKSREKLIRVNLRPKDLPEQKVAWFREVLEGSVTKKARDHQQEDGVEDKSGQ